MTECLLNPKLPSLRVSLIIEMLSHESVKLRWNSNFFYLAIFQLNLQTNQPFIIQKNLQYFWMKLSYDQIKNFWHSFYCPKQQQQQQQQHDCFHEEKVTQK